MVKYIKYLFIQIFPIILLWGFLRPIKLYSQNHAQYKDKTAEQLSGLSRGISKIDWNTYINNFFGPLNSTIQRQFKTGYIVGYDFSDLESTISQAEIDTAIVIVASRQNITVSSRDTLPSTVALYVNRNGRINVTKKFTIQGYFWAGNYQVFEGNLDSIEFVQGSIESFNPKWFGNTFHATPSFPPDSVYTVNLLGKERKIWDKSSFSNAKNNYIESYGSFENFLNYGNLVRSSGGDSLIFYFSNNDDAKIYVSTNEGRSWKGSYILFTNTIANTHFFSGTIGITSAGTWLAVMSRQYDSPDSTVKLFVKRSTDNGASWSSEISINYSFSNAYATSDIVQLSNGKLLFAYSDYSANRDTSSIKIAYSIDDGVSWTSNVLVHAGKVDTFQLSGPNVNLSEPALAVDSNDSLIIVCRIEIYGSYMFKSGDYGSTWNDVGLIGQTLSPAGTNLYNAASDLITVDDSVFVLQIGERTDGTPDKKGYIHILKGTYREIKNDSYFGWTTLMPPTFVNGDPGSNRIILGMNDELILANGHTNEFYVITQEELSQSRSWLFEQNRYASNKYSVFVNSSWYLQLPYVIDNTTYQQIATISFPFRGNDVDKMGANLIGAIPVLKMYYYGQAVSAPDTLSFELTDQSGYKMEGMELNITNASYTTDVDWLPYIPTRMHTGGLNGQLGRIEHPIFVKAKSTNTSGYEINEFKIMTGYIFK